MTNSSAMAQTWQTEIVSIGTSLEDRGSYTSLAFDLSNNPAISYYDATNGDLRYAHHVGSTWEDIVVDSTGNVGAYSSLAFDASGSPGIAYYWNDGGIGKLKYAHFNGATWDITTVDAATLVNYYMGRYCSLAFDASDKPAISYSGYYSGGYGQGTYLRYARFNGTSWNKTEVTGGCSYTSLAFDASGNPGIAYTPSDPTYYPLRYAHFNGTSWSISYVIPRTASRTTTSYPSLAFSPSTGNPAIAYGGLYFASFDTAWNITAVGSGGGHNSLAFDNAGNPAISYYNSTNADLMYAHFNGISWDTTTIDSAGSVGLYTSLAFDNAGNPAISYYEATSYHKCLKFARSVQPQICGSPIGSYNAPGALDSFVMGNVVYMVDGSGLKVLDVTDPGNPTQLGFYDTPGYASGVYVTIGASLEDIAFVADGLSGLQIIKVTNPSTTPTFTLLGSYDTPGNATGVYVSSGRAYVSDGNDIQILDVSPCQ